MAILFLMNNFCQHKPIIQQKEKFRYWMNKHPGNAESPSMMFYGIGRPDVAFHLLVDE